MVVDGGAWDATRNSASKRLGMIARNLIIS
jgi:hypothetical protein